MAEVILPKNSRVTEGKPRSLKAAYAAIISWQ